MFPLADILAFILDLFRKKEKDLKASFVALDSSYEGKSLRQISQQWISWWDKNRSFHKPSLELELDQFATPLNPIREFDSHLQNLKLGVSLIEKDSPSDEKEAALSALRYLLGDGAGWSVPVDGVPVVGDTLKSLSRLSFPSSRLLLLCHTTPPPSFVIKDYSLISTLVRRIEQEGFDLVFNEFAWPIRQFCCVANLASGQPPGMVWQNVYLAWLPYFMMTIDVSVPGYNDIVSAGSIGRLVSAPVGTPESAREFSQATSELYIASGLGGGAHAAGDLFSFAKQASQVFGERYGTYLYLIPLFALLFFLRGKK